VLTISPSATWLWISTCISENAFQSTSVRKRDMPSGPGENPGRTVLLIKSGLNISSIMLRSLPSITSLLKRAITALFCSVVMVQGLNHQCNEIKAFFHGFLKNLFKQRKQFRSIRLFEMNVQVCPAFPSFVEHKSFR